MAKKNVIRIENPFDDVHVIGIATTMIDYKLVGSINRTLNFSFTREKDIVPKNFSDTAFSFYLFFDEEDEKKENGYNLVSLRSSDKFWVPSEKKIDFLMLIRKPQTRSQLKTITEKLHEIKQVFDAFVIDVNKNKTFHQILEDIEFHEFDVKKEKNPQSNRKKMQ
jgi:hypothetical protein